MNIYHFTANSLPIQALYVTQHSRYSVFLCVHGDYWPFHAVNNLSLSLPSLSGTLKFVGLRPFDDEKRHWVALNTSIALQQLKDDKELHPRQKEELKRQTSITPKEAAAIKAISGHSIQTPHAPTSPAVTTPSPRVTTPPTVEETDAGGVARQRSEVEPDFNAREAWRRAATLRKTELKPDLWKVAYKSIKDSVTAPRDQVNHVSTYLCIYFIILLIASPGSLVDNRSVA